MKLGLHFRHPSESLVKSFIVFLARNYKTSKVVRSMFSTLRACLERAGIDVSSFQCVRVNLLMRSLDINMRQPTRQRLPVDTEIMRSLITLWQATQRAFDATRQLVWADLIWRPTYFKILIKWGKAQQKTATRFQKVPKTRDQVLCPYLAMRRLYRASSPSPESPMFAFPDGKPVPISFISKRWNKAMGVLGWKEYGFTLHSLRRGGARYLQDMGVEVASIAGHVGWKSNAVFDYVNQPSQRSTMRALKSLR